MPTDITQQSTSTSTEDNSEFIYEQVKARYDFEYERSNNLDNKANSLLGLISIVISLVLAGNGLLFGSGKDNESIQISITEIWLLITVLAPLVAALVFGCISLRLMKYIAVPEPRALIQNYRNEPKRKVVTKTCGTLVTAIENNNNQNNKKTNWVTAMWISFLIGMFFTAIFIIKISLNFIQ